MHQLVIETCKTEQNVRNTQIYALYIIIIHNTLHTQI